MIPIAYFQNYEHFKTEKGFEYMQVMHPDKISSILYEVDYAKNELYIDGISTHKDYQRNGLMTLLITQLIQWAKKTTKVMKIGLKCETEASKSFAIKFGFSPSIIDLGDHDITHILELK
jgi:RimJ/RimL family protein N-acetyltransferase